MIRFSEDKMIDWVDRLSDQDYLVIDDFIDDGLLSTIRDYYEHLLKQDEFDPAGIGALDQHHVNKKIRGDEVYWLNRRDDVALEEFFQIAEEIRLMLNRYCYLSLSGYEFHLAHYPAGSFYKRHLDQFQQRSNRLISSILYLNENWQPGDGGELKMFLPSGEKLIEPLGKRLVLFKSDAVEHEVMMTYKGRYSLTGWYLYLPQGMGFMDTQVPGSGM